MFCVIDNERIGVGEVADRRWCRLGSPRWRPAASHRPPSSPVSGTRSRDDRGPTGPPRARIADRRRHPATSGTQRRRVRGRCRLLTTHDLRHHCASVLISSACRSSPCSGSSATRTRARRSTRTGTSCRAKTTGYGRRSTWRSEGMCAEGTSAR